jgi:galactoside 2-L-fucosyltransferase 1/2
MRALKLVLVCIVCSRLVAPADECLTVEMLGRMGNLMFEYASLVGICLARGMNHTTCAHISNSNWNTWDLPIKEFIQTFNLPLTSASTCNIARRRDYREKSYMYDPHMLQVDYGTTIHGWLQSYKYFHPHAEKTLRQLYKLPEFSAHRGENFITNIRNHLPAGTVLIGVHVRLGDKINNQQNVHFYDQWSLSEAYYHKAIQLVAARHKSYALVFFSGGGENKDGLTSDRHWTKQHFSGISNHTFFDHSDDHFVSWQALSLCDSIVVGHSSFSWWAAYLSSTLEVVAPLHMFSAAAEKSEGYAADDYYPPWWTLLSGNAAEDRVIGPNLL